ncbi:MAG: leucine--tRNA ligase [Candidatus Chisholmbacteria bacterium RIFCSPLOWO2_01_FULL_50_28]|uniref:Leucine--tRNA ligase n=1 Tax=Candidatus Chisholmbacteria bacterium RIFCSPHIGHO2_01_FULL_52_32 TaxID=1797591 RepID=A0A1G1VS14_9BACT|nr:MAG: leucine--tRNA ligase [Candidatus Chisholmbacteria bacterium RIFCSPHIGHO2_01_FULL_52_32]OGY20523.1 MAG: leucine--tRNA ligase [Candidatus Chisholmbacteria bacterium RIFCSPLOWO2_01_FULL_50_28]
MEIYDHRKIERRWQKMWKEARIYQPDLRKAKKPFYNLMMFPYLSAEGLHVGNMYAFTGADIYGRFKRMQGYDVFEPIGLDGFGIHSENYAMKIGKHPAEQAKLSQKRFYAQLHDIGNSFSWENTLETFDPVYYRWTQWLFVQMFKHGLAVRKKAMVNWCPSCKTVLADEQVEGGVCERCGTPVERREMAQWFFRITDFAERLLGNLETLNWPEKIKIAQRNWIGRRDGAEVGWVVDGTREVLWTFTTRLDTIFGATFLVIAPEHPTVADLMSSKFKVKSEKLENVRVYVEAALKKTEQKRKTTEKEKTGVDTGLRVIHPLTGGKIPVWIADFVLMDVGTGVVMGVPGHDQRDGDFARKHNLPIIKVIDVGGREVQQAAVTEFGSLVTSGEFDGLSSLEAMERILERLASQGTGKKKVAYHLRDWLISRQRYWGPPIPMIFCEQCAKEGRAFKGDSLKGTLKGMAGWWPVPEGDLPVELPFVSDYKPIGDGRSPLERASESWLYTKCPRCGGRAKRETDVSDTFLDSSWYFLAYPNLGTEEWTRKKIAKLINGQIARNNTTMQPFNNTVTRRWLPVDAYIGGAEHAVLHLLYSRFVTMALHDWGYLSFEEPFPFLFSHGLIIKEGAKMSKSRGNIVTPDDYIRKFGSDTLRSYLMFIGPYDQGGDFRDTGTLGMYRFLMRVWRLYQESSKLGEKTDPNLVGPLHRMTKQVTEDLEKFRFNTALAKLMEFINAWEDGKMLSWDDAGIFLRLLAPFAPHMSEELWHNLPKKHTCLDLNCILKGLRGKPFSLSSIHVAPWPAYDVTLAAFGDLEIVVEVNGRVRGKILVAAEKANDRSETIRLAQKIPGVAAHLSGKQITKTIWVEGKLVNFVVS